MRQVREVTRTTRGRDDAIPADPCSAVLANRRRCALDHGHGGRHRWVDLDRAVTR